MYTATITGTQLNNVHLSQYFGVKGESSSPFQLSSPVTRDCIIELSFSYSHRTANYKYAYDSHHQLKGRVCIHLQLVCAHTLFAKIYVCLNTGLENTSDTVLLTE